MAAAAGPYDRDADGPFRPSDRPAPKPRDAATLILVRQGRGGEPDVLMGRRHGGHDFMPGKWVFPGGRIDRADFRAPAASELRPEVAAKLALTAPPARARALALAAVRETFEEAGLLLAKPAQVAPRTGPWAPFLAQGAAADLAALSFVARAITPPYRPKRFDARFFMAEASALTRQERLADCGELDEIAWTPLSRALELDLPNVTRFVLGGLEARLAEPERPIPFLRYRRGKSELTYL